MFSQMHSAHFRPLLAPGRTSVRWLRVRKPSTRAYCLADSLSA